MIGPSRTPPLTRGGKTGCFQRGAGRKASQVGVRFPETLPDRRRFGQGPDSDKTSLSSSRSPAIANSVGRSLKGDSAQVEMADPRENLNDPQAVQFPQHHAIQD